MNINSDIKYLKYVGEKRAELLSRLGIYTIGDLFYFFPRAYEDWSKIVPITCAPFGEVCCIKAFVGRKPVKNMINKSLTIYKTEVTDGEGVLDINIFNNKYAAEKLTEDKEFLFYGKITGGFFKKEMNSPEIFPAEGSDRIRPIYRQTAGLNSKAIEKLTSTAIELYSDCLDEVIPQSVRDKYHLPGIIQAIKEIHAPTSSDALFLAKRRMIFEELFVLQTGLRKLKNKAREETSVSLKNDFTNEFYSLLPFEPTSAQKRAISQASDDMSTGTPMNRLLQGDVGSGKTAVAAALIYNAYKNGYQSALMAPTEVLASQHYKTLCKLLEKSGIKIELLTGSLKQSEKKRIKSSLSSGETNLVIGTHALLQDDTFFSNLGLVVTDEQHRFGVNQRNTLRSKGNNPHVLVMSATPIPRTLALIIYGDLDVSVLDELPPGRQEISTFAIDSNKRIRAYNYIKKHLDEGRQGYIVCPMVDEGETTELASAVEYAEKLSKGFFREYEVGLIHGKMKPAEKEQVMSDFAQGKVKLLVATTVIEVGVDVPNAVIMVIENAERFGLSQLHQLRGRIGRGKYASTCILVSDVSSDEAKRRLKIMTETCDGFKIADEDLKMRGPGDFFGSRQHGLPELKIADMINDTETLHHAIDAINDIASSKLEILPEERPALSRAVKRLFSRTANAGLD